MSRKIGRIRETGEKSKRETQRRGAIKRELKKKTGRVKRDVSVLGSDTRDLFKDLFIF